jgi:hypothetical protein
MPPWTDSDLAIRLRIAVARPGRRLRTAGVVEPQAASSRARARR